MRGGMNLSNRQWKSLVAAFAAVPMALSSTSVSAAPSGSREPDSWAVLAALSGPASAMAVCGAANGAAVSSSAGLSTKGCVLPVSDPTLGVPPPPPPPEPESLLRGLTMIAWILGYYTMFDGVHHPNSPP